ncbi:transcription antitermination factor NusB [Virgibacillus sp. DJP39]|uniref:transcription antitermination factor NusB n=1 Tax=Virgibacillus sp. DJP39 TaxID=3409790 RepID=UPI003BB5EBEF
MRRHAAREKAFQLLFQIDLNELNPNQVLANHNETGEADSFLEKLVQGVVEHKQQIDEKISNHLENWSIQRIASVEKTILRIATYEIDYLDEIPTNVSINEAVDLAKEYGDEKSGKFVNGVLKKIIA